MATDLLTVLSEHRPKLMSNGQIRCECPFRDKHTDGSGEYSFFVSPEINAYHCFSCRSKGNLVKLLTTQFKVNYFEAVEMVNLVDYVPKKEKSFDLDIIWEITPPRQFVKRGFSKEILVHKKFGITDDGWTIIPFEKDGVLVGYQRRMDYPDRVVRNNEGFDKEHFLYGGDFSQSYIIVVEGYSDQMRLEQLGFNCTATLGADVSFWQAETICKVPKVYSAFDNDMAGRRATEILYILSRDTRCDLQIVPYLEKDPAEVKSRRVWNSYLQESTSYMEYTMAMTMEWDAYLDMKEEVFTMIQKRKEKHATSD